MFGIGAVASSSISGLSKLELSGAEVGVTVTVGVAVGQPPPSARAGRGSSIPPNIRAVSHIIRIDRRVFMGRVSFFLRDITILLAFSS